jgi:hypothetical protein
MQRAAEPFPITLCTPEDVYLGTGTVNAAAHGRHKTANLDLYSVTV